jgi:hypothetical protein
MSYVLVKFEKLELVKLVPASTIVVWKKKPLSGGFSKTVFHALLI